jgi:outer membrane protein assembly factor BamB
MNRLALLALALAVVASAAVYVSEGGDVVYFSTLGQFGALNGLGQLLWVVDAPSPLIATDPMGSCLAMGYSVSNGTVWLV